LNIRHRVLERRIVSGYRFSDTISPAKRVAPLGAVETFLMYQVIYVWQSYEN